VSDPRLTKRNGEQPIAAYLASAGEGERQEADQHQQSEERAHQAAGRHLPESVAPQADATPRGDEQSDGDGHMRWSADGHGCGGCREMAAL